MYCINCKNELNENDIYCIHCGTKIERCSNCHKVIKPNSHYCAYCGYHLIEEIKEKPVKQKVNWFVVIGSVLLLVVATVISSIYLIKNGDIVLDEPVNETLDTEFTVGDQYPSYMMNCNISQGGTVYSDSDYIYICDENFNLIRMDHDMNNEMTIIDNCNYINVVNDLIYYADENNSLCICDRDGNNQDVILDKEIYYLVYNDGYLYYQLDEDNESIYRYHIESKVHTKLNDVISYEINVTDEYIYYFTLDGIYRMNKDGSDNILLLDEDVYALNYYNNVLYYANEDNQILAYDLNTNNKDIIIDGGSMYFGMSDEYLYYIGSDACVYTYDLRTEDVKCIYNGYASNIQVLDGCVIIDAYTYSDEFKLLVSTDGDIQIRLFAENSDNYI